MHNIDGAAINMKAGISYSLLLEEAFNKSIAAALLLSSVFLGFALNLLSQSINNFFSSDPILLIMEHS
jgi:hypothetical protein